MKPTHWLFIITVALFAMFAVACEDKSMPPEAPAEKAQPAEKNEAEQAAEAVKTEAPKAAEKAAPEKSKGEKSKAAPK